MKKYFPWLFFLALTFLRAEEITYSSPLVDNSVGLVKSFVKSMAIIIVMLVLFVIWKRNIMPSMLEKKSSGQKMRIVEKLFLDYSTMLYLVEIGSKYQIYGVSTKNITLLNTLNKSELPREKIIKKAGPQQFSEIIKNLKSAKGKKRA